MGEFGFIGFVLLIISLTKFFVYKMNYNLVNLILINYLITLLMFDFSLHIPLIQINFVIFFILNKKIIQ